MGTISKLYSALRSPFVAAHLHIRATGFRASISATAERWAYGFAFLLRILGLDGMLWTRKAFPAALPW